MHETSCELRVRYAETDGMGIVYYANYLAWFEVARSEFLREKGASYRDIENENVYLPVVEAHCRYHHPARYDDVVSIRIKATRPSRAQLHFEYELRRADGDVLLATGSTLHVAVNDQGKPQRLPPKLMELFE